MDRSEVDVSRASRRRGRRVMGGEEEVEDGDREGEGDDEEWESGFDRAESDPERGSRPHPHTTC
jgi:hypothetical protein